MGGGPRDPPHPKPALTTLWQVSVVAVVGALLAAPLIPVADLLDRNGGAGGDNPGAAGYQLSVVNPFIRLHRDLVEQTHTPLLYAETDASSTSYIRTTVLDRFTGEEWRPSSRDLPGTNTADGLFPSPPGLAPNVGGTEHDWSFQFAHELRQHLAATALPDPRARCRAAAGATTPKTLDVAYVGGAPPPDLKYTATSFTPSITAQLLNSTVSAPKKLREPMTAVPEDLPEVITTRAKQVTRGAKDDFAKAVALQDWFRQNGGFRYSLEQRSGSGMDLLAAFVTDDRVGYCEQFAAAMAAMGRVLGIPSRVVVGLPVRHGQSDGRVLYTSDDRHAWPEMYFSGVGWVRFEPTPGQRAGATPPWTRQDANPVAPHQRPERRTHRGRTQARRVTESDVESGDNRGLPIPSWPILALVILAVVGLVPGLVRATQRRRRLSGERPGPSRRRGLGRAPGDCARHGSGLARGALPAGAGAPGGGPGQRRG